jgi:asparagine synthase (glutamine-hydrolysing)
MVGIRVRFPLLDHQLVQFSGTVPSGLKMRGWQKRYIFKQAMTGLLPNRILYKKKHGFGVPIGRWLLEHASLKSLISDVLHDSKTRQRGYFLPSFLDRLLELHWAGHASYYGEVLWYIFILECWHRQHLERALEVVSVAN